MSSSTRSGVVGAVAGLALLGAVAFALPTHDGRPQPGVASATMARGTEEAGATTSSVEHGHSDVTDNRDARSTTASRLIAQTRRTARQWRNVAAARDDGFESIGDEITGHEHYVQWAWARDDVVLDPRRPEALVYEVEGFRRRLVSAMYILPPGSTMRDVPDIGDKRAQWHRHTNLCWSGRRVAGLYYDGRCVPAGERRATTPMLHVWLTQNRCGPFAGLGVHGGHCDNS